MIAVFINKLIDAFMGDIPIEQRVTFYRMLFRGVFMLHVAWACGWLPGIQGFALAGELEKTNKELTIKLTAAEEKFDELKKQIARGTKIQIRTAYEAELRRLNQEIFEIEAKIREIARTGRQPDRIYDQRLSDLVAERERVESNLQAFKQANPEIIGATF